MRLLRDDVHDPVRSATTATAATAATAIDDDAPTGPPLRGDDVDTERLLDALFANSDDAIVVVGSTGEIRYMSRRTSMLLGHDRHAAVGRSVFDYLHPDDVDAVAEVFVRRLDFAGADQGKELRVLDAAGSSVPVDVTVSLLPEPTGGLDLGACVIHLRCLDDDHQQRELALRRRIVVTEYANQLGADLMAADDADAVFERVHVALSEIGLLTGADTAGIVVETSAGATTLEPLAWWSAHELEGLGTPTLSPDPASVERLLNAPIIAGDLATEEPGLHAAIGVDAVGLLSVCFTASGRRGALMLLRSDETATWWDSDAELTRVVVGLIGRAIETAWTERLLALTYRDGPTAFCLHNWSGELLDCNERLLQLFGITRPQATHVIRAAVLPTATQARWFSLVDRLRNGEIDRFDIDLEVTRADGTPMWLECRSTRLTIAGSNEGLIVTSCTDVTTSHTQRLELEHTATHDALTGVVNRSAMLAVLDAAAQRGELPTALVVDLDRFKLVNDGFGHHVGDTVLQVVARRLRHGVRPDATVARLGGDEFAIALPGTTLDEARTIAARLGESVAAPIQVEGHRLVQTVSIGIASGSECTAPDELIVCADRALYAAKHQGRACQVVFNASERVPALGDVRLERELAIALENGELDVHFQPEFTLDDRRVVGAEALLRWHHPERGLLPAGQFIAVAERTGMIDDIGRFALRQATWSFARACREAGLDDLVLRVNLSAREFARPELTELVRSALRGSDFDPGRLCLEMTETTLMDAPDVALTTLDNLHELGVQFAIDDFGTGYSSLAYLKRFPVDVLKIDRTFVNDIAHDTDSHAIVASIVHLAKVLALDVVAEGVEEESQLDVLRELGCGRAQGYLVARPMPLDEFIGLASADR